MKKLFTTATLVLLAVFTLSAANYKLDDQSVDALFDNAVETSISGLEAFNSNTADMHSLASTQIESNTMKVVVACVVDYVGLGAFGIHRYILGTKGSMWAIYTFTVCGIFGIVPTVDFWVMIIDGLILKNADKYIDNEKFFMWF